MTSRKFSSNVLSGLEKLGDPKDLNQIVYLKFLFQRLFILTLLGLRDFTVFNSITEFHFKNLVIRVLRVKKKGREISNISLWRARETFYEVKEIGEHFENAFIKA